MPSRDGCAFFAKRAGGRSEAGGMTGRTAGLAALLLLGAGCAFTSVGPGAAGGNPDYPGSDHSFPEDGARDAADPDIHRIVFDQHGDPAPDPRRHVVDDRIYAEAGHGMRAYARAAGLAYDPAEIRGEYARRLNERGGTLVILIHGINNTYDEARRSYELARMKLGRRAGGLSFLEVYWDGRTGNPLALWSHARESSKWVGLGLRPLLRALSPGLRVRVLTHSRGASVITSALWNLPLREGADADRRFEARQAAEPVPDARRYRLALLVPAMPEEDFETCPRDGLDRVIVGVNPDDPVVGKGPLPSSMMGSTRLGESPEAFRSSVAPALERRAFLVILPYSPVHDFKEYLLRRGFEERMLPLLLEGDGYQERSMPAVSRAP